MAAQKRITILFPVGRFVGGDLYVPNDKDADGNPLVVKNGPNKGQPTVQYFCAVAIPKQAGHTHWAQAFVDMPTKIGIVGDKDNPPNGKWGETLWQFGHAQWPQGQAQNPAFAWKIEDGDSTIPNKKGKKNCDREGYPGNWIVKFSSGIAPKTVNADGTQVLDMVGAIKPGYFVQVCGSIASNLSDQSPGLYVGHTAVALAGYGPEISYGPDVSTMGFGGAPLPPGASQVPVGAMTPPAVPGTPGAAPAVPGVGGAPAIPGVPGATAGAPAVPGIPVVPNVPFVANAGNVPGVPGVPSVPAAPVVPKLVMTPKAGTATLEQFRAQVPPWSDELLVSEGYAVWQ